MREFVYKTYRTLLNSWVKPKIHGCDQLIEELKDDTPVFYVLEYRSYADLLVIDRICKQHNLPSPYKRSEIPQLEKSYVGTKRFGSISVYCIAHSYFRNIDCL